MAVSLALVFATVENTLASFTALEDLSLFTALYNSRALSTLAAHQSSFMLTWFALAFMTQLGTRMRTEGSSLSTTNLTTRMWLNLSFILWILELATITVILGHNLIILELTLRTAPSKQDLVLILIPVDIQDPCLDAVQMHGNVAAVTCPNVVSLFYIFRANDTRLLLKVAAVLLLETGILIVLSFERARGLSL